MNKLKKIELLLGMGITTSPFGFGFANDIGLEWNSYEVLAGKSSKSDIDLVKNPCGIVAGKDSNPSVIELDFSTILEIISMISAAEMSEEVRSKLLEQLQSGEGLLLKNPQAPHYIVIRDGCCLLVKNRQCTIGEDILKRAKIFPIDPRLFDEIRIYIFEPAGNSILRRMIRKAKHMAYDGSKWMVVTGIPILAKCSWDIAKIAVKTGGNFAVKNPLLTATAVGGWSLCFVFKKMCSKLYPKKPSK
jgi:hypothetical protein